MRGLDPRIHLLAKMMGCRVISAFTRVFRRAMPGNDGWKTLVLMRVHHVRGLPEKSALPVRHPRQDRDRHRRHRRVRRAGGEGARRRWRQRRALRQQCRRTEESRGRLRTGRRQSRDGGQAAELGSKLRRDCRRGGQDIRPRRYPRGRVWTKQGVEDRRPEAGRFSRRHGRQRDAVLADRARRRAADAQAGPRRQSDLDVVGARASRPSRRIHRLLRLEVSGRRHHQGAGLRMGRQRHHRQRARADRVSLAADPMDVRGHRSLARRAQRLPHARAQRPARGAIRSRRAVVVPRVQGVGFLHRPYPLCRRRLHGGMTMAKARIAVIGAGLMGHGIAQVFALAGHEVSIHDSIAANLDSAKARILANLKDLGDDSSAVERVRPTADLAAAVREADYVVEAVLEDLPLKQKLFAEIETHVRPGTILASNTSVIPITKIMEGLRDRSRALGTHWWNPPYLVPLIEVIGTQWTSPAAIEGTMALHKAAGKMPVHVKKDVPGFVGNRLQHALWREAIALVERGICDAETVDTVIKASFGRRLAVLGPLENADLVGTDLTLAIHKTVLPDIENRGGPSPYLEALVANGKLGFKSGEGFRPWSAQAQAELRAKVLQHLKKARTADG